MVAETIETDSSRRFQWRLPTLFMMVLLTAFDRN